MKNKAKPKKKESARIPLQAIYKKLNSHYGPLNWWPGDSPFEVVTGAILTQNTNWDNVSKAISNLKSAGLLCPRGAVQGRCECDCRAHKAIGLL